VFDYGGGKGANVSSLDSPVSYAIWMATTSFTEITISATDTLTIEWTITFG
jgi:hypothetical protein